MIMGLSISLHTIFNKSRGAMNNKCPLISAFRRDAKQAGKVQWDGICSN